MGPLNVCQTYSGKYIFYVAGMLEDTFGQIPYLDQQSIICLNVVILVTIPRIAGRLDALFQLSTVCKHRYM